MKRPIAVITALIFTLSQSGWCGPLLVPDETNGSNQAVSPTAQSSVSAIATESADNVNTADVTLKLGPVTKVEAISTDKSSSSSKKTDALTTSEPITKSMVDKKAATTTAAKSESGSASTASSGTTGTTSTISNPGSPQGSTTATFSQLASYTIPAGSPAAAANSTAVSTLAGMDLNITLGNPVSSTSSGNAIGPNQASIVYSSGYTLVSNTTQAIGDQPSQTSMTLVNSNGLDVASCINGNWTISDASLLPSNASTTFANAASATLGDENITNVQLTPSGPATVNGQSMTIPCGAYTLTVSNAASAYSALSSQSLTGQFEMTVSGPGVSTSFFVNPEDYLASLNANSSTQDSATMQAALLTVPTPSIPGVRSVGSVIPQNGSSYITSGDSKTETTSGGFTFTTTIDPNNPTEATVNVTGPLYSTSSSTKSSAPVTTLEQVTYNLVNGDWVKGTVTPAGLPNGFSIPYTSSINDPALASYIKAPNGLNIGVVESDLSTAGATDMGGVTTVSGSGSELNYTTNNGAISIYFPNPTTAVATWDDKSSSGQYQNSSVPSVYFIENSNGQWTQTTNAGYAAAIQPSSGTTGTTSTTSSGSSSASGSSGTPGTTSTTSSTSQSGSRGTAIIGGPGGVRTISNTPAAYPAQTSMAGMARLALQAVPNSISVPDDLWNLGPVKQGSVSYDSKTGVFQQSYYNGGSMTAKPISATQWEVTFTSPKGQRYNETETLASNGKWQASPYGIPAAPSNLPANFSGVALNTQAGEPVYAYIAYPMSIPILEQNALGQYVGSYGGFQSVTGTPTNYEAIMNNGDRMDVSINLQNGTAQASLFSGPTTELGAVDFDWNGKGWQLNS